MYSLLARPASQLFQCLSEQRRMEACKLVYQVQMLLIFITILWRKNYYPILQIKKWAERLIFLSPCDYMWWD